MKERMEKGRRHVYSWEDIWKHASGIRDGAVDALRSEDFKKSLRDEDRAEYERELVAAIEQSGVDGGGVRHVFDYRGFPIEVCRHYCVREAPPHDGVWVPYARVRTICPEQGWILLEDPGEGACYLDAIDEHFEHIAWRAPFDAFIIFSQQIERKWMRPERPRSLDRGRVDSFRSEFGEKGADFKVFLDAADEEALGSLSAAHESFVEGVRKLGYRCVADCSYSWGGMSAVVLAETDPDLIELVWSERGEDLKMAAAYFGEATARGSMPGGEPVELCGAGSESGILQRETFALKSWGRECGKMPVTHMLAEFCCFDRMTCDAAYGCDVAPRWRDNQSLLPNMAHGRGIDYGSLRSAYADCWPRWKERTRHALPNDWHREFDGPDPAV